jgi:hypothetical protein
MAKSPVLSLSQAEIGRTYRAALFDGSPALVLCESRGRPRSLEGPALAVAINARILKKSQQEIADFLGCSTQAIRTALGEP